MEAPIGVSQNRRKNVRYQKRLGSARPQDGNAYAQAWNGGLHQQWNHDA